MPQNPIDTIPEFVDTVPYSDIDKENPLSDPTEGIQTPQSNDEQEPSIPERTSGKRKSLTTFSRRSHRLKSLHKVAEDDDSEYQTATEEMESRVPNSRNNLQNAAEYVTIRRRVASRTYDN